MLRLSPFSGFLLPAGNSNRTVSLAELSVRGSLRLTHILFKTYPRAAKWLIKRQRPPAREVRELFEALGTTYIKIGQFIASSPSIFPADYVEEFQMLLDRTAPIPYRKIKKLVEQDLKQPIRKVFSYFDPEPLASASIAQVHAAVLKSGEQVVVKVQKPGVAAEIMVDLNTVYILTRLFELMLPSLDQDAIAGIIEEMYQAMIDECDFAKEANNLDVFRQFLRDTGNQQVTAPKPYRQASASKVLTMERFHGCSLIDENASQQPVNVSDSLFQALNTWFLSLTQCDFFHADLHSGNMLLLDDGRVGFIDFGMVGRISPDVWAAMFDLFNALNSQDYQGVAEAMLTVGITREQVDLDRLNADITNLFESLYQVQSSSRIKHRPHHESNAINDLMIQLSEIGKNHGIRFPRAFTMLLKQFLYFDRYLQLLVPGASVFDNPNINMFQQ